MFAVRPLIVPSLVFAALLALSGCQGDATPSASSSTRTLARGFTWQPLYGDGTNDASGIIAKVGEVEITARDLELYLDEMPSVNQVEFQGPMGERLLLSRMIENALLVQGGVKEKVFNDPDVARTLIAERRNTLKSGMINYGLLRGKSPSEEEQRTFFMNNRDNYRQLGVVDARHIECKTKADADEAYQRLVKGGPGNDWMSVLVSTTVNEESKALEGSTGWFNQGGIIPYIAGSKKFTAQAYDLDVGLHPPFMIADRWHVVEILSRHNERPMTFAEARNQVEIDMLPAWQDAIIRDYLLAARQEFPVEMLGRFAPGQGLTVEELFAQANAVTDGEKKIELLNLIHTDYPESGRADDALFMAALTAIDTWTDIQVAERYLRLLLEEYPDSELAEDAQFLKDNLYNPDALNPQSIEDLRK